MKKYYYPIILKNENSLNFEISSEITLRNIRQEEKEEFFGLEKADYFFAKNRMPGWIAFSHFYPKGKGRWNYKDAFKVGIFDGTSDILAANYVIEVKADESNDLLNKINIALSLLKPSSSSINIGFKEKETDASFSAKIKTYPGIFPYCSLSEDELLELKSIYTDVVNLYSDEKFSMACDFYRKAISAEENSLEMRFVSLSILLEMLFLPDDNAEVKFKFALRISKIFAKECGEEPNKYYQLAKSIYDRRSEIVHNGLSKKMTGQLFYDLVEISRRSIQLYLRDKDIFKKNNLEDICVNS